MARLLVAVALVLVFALAVDAKAHHLHKKVRTHHKTHHTTHHKASPYLEQPPRKLGKGFLSHPDQTYRKPTGEKNTPGPRCSSFKTCMECAQLHICVWSHDGESQSCMDERNPLSVLGTRICGDPTKHDAFDQQTKRHIEIEEDVVDSELKGDSYPGKVKVIASAIGEGEPSIRNEAIKSDAGEDGDNPDVGPKDNPTFEPWQNDPLQPQTLPDGEPPSAASAVIESEEINPDGKTFGTQEEFEAVKNEISL